MIAALAVTLAVSFHGPPGLDCGLGSFTAIAEGGQRLHGDWKPAAVLQLDAFHAWRLETTSLRCWTPAVSVPAGATATTVPVWAKRSLRGRLSLPRGASLPAFIEARISSPPRAEVPAVPETIVRCPVTDGRFVCEVPAVPIDVRVFAEGFAPHYAWNVTGNDLGELHLSSGALITGRASVPADEPQNGISVELRRSSFAWSPDDVQREVVQSRQTKTNARGFFSFSNVPPGEYTVIARKDGWSAAEDQVHVAGSATEAVVGKELILPELGRLEIVITPPVDALQRPWKVQLDRRVNAEAILVAEGKADLNGVWRYDGADTGSYAVVVLDENGSRVSADGVLVTGGPMTIPIRIEQVMIRGSVTLDGEPVPARLRFNDGHGRIASFTTDDEGKLSGALAREGKWDIDVRPRGSGAEIRLKDIEVRRSDATGFADLELELPAGRVRGKLVDVEGQPVQGWVSIRRGRDFVASGNTAADGTFDLAGVPPGEVTLLATTQNREESELITHRVKEGDGDPLNIVVRKKHRVRARLLTADGRRVAGAQIHVLTAHRMWREHTTDPSGEVSFSASPGASHVRVAIVAHGLPLKFSHVAAGAGREPVDIVFSPIPGGIFIALEPMQPPHLSIGPTGEAPYWLPSVLNHSMQAASKPARRVADGIQLLVEPGTYTICNQKRTTCETVRVAAGARATVDARGWEE
jgi:Carboxypeptidase regulatory-like domain